MVKAKLRHFASAGEVAIVVYFLDLHEMRAPPIEYNNQKPSDEKRDKKPIQHHNRPTITKYSV